MTPFFSIVIPTYNRAALLKLTLISLFNQSYQNFEILVIDDGGNDHTEDVVKAFEDPRITYYWKENAERGAARNYGANLAKGSYLNFFDSDDVAYENHLQTAADYIIANLDVIVFHTSYNWKFPNTEVVNSTTVNLGVLNSKIFKNNILSANNVFVRKPEFDLLKFSENRALSRVEDWELWIRLCCRYEIYGLPQVTSTVIEHQQRSTSNVAGDDVLAYGKVLVESLKYDVLVCKMPGNIIKNIDAEMKSLAALYYSIEDKKEKSIKYFFKSFLLRPSIIYSRRTLAIFKYLLIK